MPDEIENRFVLWFVCVFLAFLLEHLHMAVDATFIISINYSVTTASL